VKHALNLFVATFLALCCATGLQAQPPAPTIKQLFGFACDANTKVCPDGKSPNSLIQSADGNFYGTTPSGGTGNQAAGTVFKITPSGQLSTVYTFVADQKGNYPNGGGPNSLVEGNDGFLYGTAGGGGANNQGVVFKLSHAGDIHVLHSFCLLTNCADGSGPLTLLLANDGNLYGATMYSFPGTLFRITPAGTYTLLHTFNLKVDGPQCIGMTLASDGNIYGTTLGARDLLTVLFRLTPAGQFTVLQTLHYAQFPVSAPIQALDGKLYGGLSRFEDQAEPGIFASSLSGSDFRNILLSPFAFGDYVAYMTSASDSNLWSVIFGNSLQPEVISLSTDGKLLQTATFDGTNGANPDAPLVQGSDGTFFGVAEFGGSVQRRDLPSGVVFTLDAGLGAPKPAFVSFKPSRGKVGLRVMLHGSHFVGTTAVTFNGVRATFRVLNTGNILATVPQGATTGPIGVTNPGGTATSKKTFTVQ
jgi:uncharacterized repeat protein (TIGR03803 family)